MCQENSGPLSVEKLRSQGIQKIRTTETRENECPETPTKKAAGWNFELHNFDITDVCNPYDKRTYLENCP